MLNVKYTMSGVPKYTYQIWLTDSTVFNATGKMPRLFHRFMLELVFGIRIVPIKEST